MTQLNYHKSILLLIIAVVILILFMQSIASAEGFGGYIGLFADDQRDEYCIEIDPSITFSMWVFVWPFGEGILAVGLSVQYCDNVIQVEEEYNPLLHGGSIGNLNDGFDAVFEECQTDWVWVARQTLYMVNEEGCILRISGFPPNSYADMLSCASNYYLLREFSMLGVNVPCSSLSTEESSWGAIKNLYK